MITWRHFCHRCRWPGKLKDNGDTYHFECHRPAVVHEYGQRPVQKCGWKITIPKRGKNGSEEMSGVRSTNSNQSGDVPEEQMDLF